MKAVDPNHMVTVGEEGFYGFGAPAASIATNPNTDNTGWAEKAGQNFLDNHTPASIDFAATHIWTDNWEVCMLDIQIAYICTIPHVTVCPHWLP